VAFEQQKEVYSKVRELCKNMNDWFDLCNSKDPDGNTSFLVTVTPTHAVEIADKYLGILRWFQDWKESVTDDTGNVQLEFFIPMETYQSLENCCNGFASLIYEQCVNKKCSIVLNRANQDCCEHHFSHVHSGCGHCRHPMQSNANACALTSHLKRSLKASARGNVAFADKKQRTI